MGALKIKKICSSPKVIQPRRPKSDSAPPGAIWAKFEPKQPHQKAISDLGSKSALSNLTLLALINLKIGLFLLTKTAPFIGLKQIFLLDSVEMRSFLSTSLPGRGEGGMEGKTQSQEINCH